MGLCSKNLNVTLDPCSATTKNRQPFDINFKWIHINMRLSSHVQRSGSTWVKCPLVLGSRWILIQMRVWGSQSVVRFYNAVVPESLHNTKFKCRSQLLTFSYIHLSLHVHQTIFFFQLSISLSCCPNTLPSFSASGVIHVQLQFWKERSRKVLWVFTCEVRYKLMQKMFFKEIPVFCGNSEPP